MVTGWNSDFSFLFGIIVTISTGDIVVTTVTSEVGYVLLGVENNDKLADNWALVNTGSFVATICTS